ncbi:MAG: flagellar protein FliT [Thermoleophilia bacterium]|nr:flagellar protein FliT [Thermoleophilia bacterium]
MLDDLRRLRELQLEQARALAAADLDRLSALDHERKIVQARIVPADAPPLGSADLAEARALAQALRRGQDDLIERASAARDALRGEMGNLGVGRAALAGYRPQPLGSSLYLDRSR